MKNKLPTILLSLSLVSLLGFSTGDEIELDGFLNARTNPNFVKYAKNIATTLSEGTTGKVLEIKKFESGNSGIKMKVTSGPKSGKSYWVYYNIKDPAIKLTSKKNKKEVEPQSVELKTTDQPKETYFAQSLRDVSARRDAEEHALEQSTQVATDTVQRESLQEMLTPKRPPCPLTENTSIENKETYSPQAALADINSGDLKFIGRDLMPGFSQNKTCIYQNAKVYVLYNHCMANRKEADATDIEVISKQGGTVKFYLEVFTDKKMSKLKRDEYVNGTFSVAYSKTKPPGDLNVAKTKDFINSNEHNGDACFIGLTFKAADKDTRAKCMGDLEEKTSEWAPEAESFWANPPQEWYTTQSKLRKLVESTPF